MSPTWGSVEQYSGIIWPWPIAVYLFLAGLSAGAIISAIIVKWMKVMILLLGMVSLKQVLY